MAVKNISRLAKELLKAFKNKDYRHAYVDEFLNLSIATQIKVLREQRNWTQKELADRVGMAQPRISVMENVNYSSWSINILRKLAKTFDLTLRVSFEGFGSRVNDIEQFSRETLERPSFEDDPVFAGKEEEAIIGPAMALVEANRDLARSNEIPTIDLTPKKAMSLAARQTNPYWRQPYEAPIRKTGTSHLAH